MSFQPTPAGVLVEIITRLHRFIHVLQEASGFKVPQRQKGKERQRDRIVGLENSFFFSFFWQRADFVCRINYQKGKEKAVPLTCGNTVRSCAHTVEAGAKQLAWKNQCQHLWESICNVWQITPPVQEDVVWNTELILQSVFVCMCVTGIVYVSSDSVTFVWPCWAGSKRNYSITLTIRGAGFNMTHANLSHSVILCSIYKLKVTDTHLQLLSSLTHSTC